MSDFSRRGFASMDPELQKAIASMGGKAAHAKGTAHEFTSDEASAAAKKGHSKGKAHEYTPEEARIAGAKGGKARWAKIKAAQAAQSAPSASSALQEQPTNEVQSASSPAPQAAPVDGGVAVTGS